MIMLYICSVSIYLIGIRLVQISYFCSYFIQLFILFMDNTQPPKYTKIDKLGEGSFGVVYKAITNPSSDSHAQNPSYVAIKRIPMASEEEGMPSTALREISILKEVKHPNIVRLHDVLSQSNNLMLVFEYVDYDMKKYLSKFKEKGLNQIAIQVLSYQLLKGIQYLHHKKILHRDLKPQNLLISEQLILKIADFGLARTFGIPSKPFAHEVITLWYRPPELLLGCQNYSSSIDIWSIGCIMAEMSNLRPLMPGKKEQEQINRIFQIFGTPNNQTWEGVEKLPLWKKYQINQYKGIDLSNLIPKLGQLGVDLVKKMLEVNPQKRITATEALKHKFFEEIPRQILRLYE